MSFGFEIVELNFEPINHNINSLTRFKVDVLFLKDQSKFPIEFSTFIATFFWVFIAYHTCLYLKTICYI